MDVLKKDDWGGYAPLDCISWNWVFKTSRERGELDTLKDAIFTRSCIGKVEFERARELCINICQGEIVNICMK